MSRRLVAVVLLVASAATGSAQSARVRGVVVDGQRRPVPGVSVTGTGPGGVGVTTTTDGAGSFSVDAPASGRYEVRAELEGFAVESAVDLAVNW